MAPRLEGVEMNVSTGTNAVFFSGGGWTRHKRAAEIEPTSILYRRNLITEFYFYG